jgi:cytochrome c553
MKKSFLFTGVIACFLGSPQAQAQDSVVLEGFDVATADSSAGEDIYQSGCKNCHGRTGKGLASFPRLAGNEADYLVARLIAYRNGEAIGPNSPLMWPWAKELSDKDIVNITAYITNEFE